MRKIVVLFFWGCLSLNSMQAASGLNLAGHMEGMVHRIRARKLESRFDAIFTKLRNTYGFNGAVLLSENNHVVYRKALGYADLKTRDTLSTNSIFQLASVSKQFTAIAIMMLHSRRLLYYDDPVTKYYPDFPWPEITVRQLLTHRSGLPDYRWFLDPYLEDKFQPISNQFMMQAFTKYTPDLYFRPNAHFAYSNTGYAVLAAIVEKVSGLRFSRFMELAVFRPLGMKNTYVYSKCERPEPRNAVKGYERNGHWQAPNDAFNGITGDKNVYSSVEDLFLWDQALYSNKLLPQKLLEEAFLPGSPENRSGKNYGFGWRMRTGEGARLVFHSGWWRGFRTFFLRNLDTHSSVILLSNTVNYSINGFRQMYASVMQDGIDSLETE
jgi:CubicO group peptidase (beta-lactamase class C family)